MIPQKFSTLAFTTDETKPLVKVHLQASAKTVGLDPQLCTYQDLSMHHDWRALGFHGNDRIQLPCRYRDLKITEPKNSFSETYPDMFIKLRDQNTQI